MFSGCGNPARCHCQSFAGLGLNAVVCWLCESMAVYNVINYSLLASFYFQYPIMFCCARAVFVCREHHQPKIVFENVLELEMSWNFIP